MPDAFALVNLEILTLTKSFYKITMTTFKQIVYYINDEAKHHPPTNCLRLNIREQLNLYFRYLKNEQIKYDMI